jgi:hypothetical protein
MVMTIFEDLCKPEPKNHFTIGINDDVSFTSLDYDPSFSIANPKTVRCVFLDWVQMVRLAQTRTQSKSSVKKQITGHRASSYTTRRNQAR